MNGSTIIEINGADHEKKADILTTEIQNVLKGEALITRPSIKGELKLIGLEESSDSEEISYEVARAGDCNPSEVKVSNIKRTRSGLGIAWVKSPVQAAIKIAKEKKLKIDWTVVKVELLRARPLQCFKCWMAGHTKEKCRSSVDYSKLLLLPMRKNRSSGERLHE